MPLRNTTTSFGWVSRLIHWAMAVLILFMMGLGSYITRMEVSLANLWLFGLHKSVGLLLLCMVLARIAWHRASPPPRPLSDGVAWHDRLATTVHRAFYVLLVAIPLAGWVASAASGLDVVVFERWTLPRIAPVSEAWEDGAFAIHAFLTKLLFVLLLLHVAGGLSRRNGTLRRMVRGDSGLEDQ